METERAERDLRGQMANRALLYRDLLLTLSEELGQERAEALLARAIYRRGEAIGQQFRAYAPDDFAGLRDAFLGIVPGGQDLFKPEVRRCDSEGLEIKFGGCPLKEAWLAAGVPEGEVASLCRIAGTVDLGTFEAAGFAIENRTWQPGRDGCCHLVISPRAHAKGDGA
ncbi:MAG: L-2-amino-thiazoline-4-carboxylic acid hydrolase [Elioraea sp.]|nr:L-2-amino-thiazoline-4-carboxylic acid hydrolase [Elioraea sp.]MDW8443663.1 L-2-amino-thiazoline-4-carboxylic acid hydrolase [Acetobacteraceae bacterium]